MSLNTIKIILAALALPIFSAGNGNFATESKPLHAYLIAAKGQYIEIDPTTLQVIGQGNIWDNVTVQRPQWATILSNKEILDSHIDSSSNRLFILVGSAKAGLLNGYIVLRSTTLKLEGIISQEMDLGPTTLIPNPNDKRIYVGYLSGGKGNDHGHTTTAIFNNETYMREGELPGLALKSPSCLVQGTPLLYSDHNVIDTRSNTVSQKVRIGEGPFVPVQCQSNRVLAVLESKAKTILPAVYDLKEGRVVGTIETDIPFRLNTGEWNLSPDGSTVIRDERESATIGAGVELRHTGRLTFFDVRTGAKLGHVQLANPSETSHILGYSGDGKMLVYQVASAVSVIDIHRRVEVGQIDWPLDIKLVDWP